MAEYANIFTKKTSRKATSQREPIPGREAEMHRNRAGGYVFTTSDDQFILRFLVQGTEGNTFYATKQELTVEAAERIHKMILANAAHVALVVDSANRVQVDENGQTIPAAVGRKSPSLFVLAMAKVFAKTDEDRQTVHNVIRSRNVISTLAQLYEFLAYIYQMNGSGLPKLDGSLPHGNGFKRAIRDWMTGHGRDERWLAMQIAKYRSRNFKIGSESHSRGRSMWGRSAGDTRPSLNLTMRDVLRLAHVTPENEIQQILFGWAVNMGRANNDAKKIERIEVIEGIKDANARLESDALAYAVAFEEMQDLTDGKEAARLIREHGLTWEMIPSHLYGKNAPEADRRLVWRTLMGLDGASRRMPFNALLRNLPRISAYGLTKDSDVRAFIREVMSDQDALVNARVHPIALLSALRVYRRGYSTRPDGSRAGLEWMPDNGVANAIEKAYHASFGLVQPIGGRVGFFLDTSGSMRSGKVNGIEGLTPLEAEAIMTATLVRTEDDWLAMGFTSYPDGSTGWGYADRSAKMRSDFGMTHLPFSASPSLEEATGVLHKYSFNGGTDCAIPFMWATENREHIDLFVIQTDNQTWANTRYHPSQALAEYRRLVNPEARCAVIGYTVNQSSIADPTDLLTTEFVGFDATAPQMLAKFGRGEL